MRPSVTCETPSHPATRPGIQPIATAERAAVRTVPIAAGTSASGQSAGVFTIVARPLSIAPAPAPRPGRPVRGGPRGAGATGTSGFGTAIIVRIQRHGPGGNAIGVR